MTITKTKKAKPQEQETSNIVNEASFTKLVEGGEAAIFKEQATQNRNIDKGLKGYQSLALAVMVHVANHKDIRVLRKFIEDMPEGLRIKAMAVYFSKYAPVKMDDEGVFHYDPMGKLQLGLAMENAWWKSTPPERIQPFNFDVELQRLVDKAKKRMEKNIEGDVIDLATFEAVKKLAATFVKPEAEAKAAA